MMLNARLLLAKVAIPTAEEWCLSNPKAEKELWLASPGGGMF